MSIPTSDSQEDVPGKSKNKLINHAFAWMFHVAVSNATGSLSWLLPNHSKYTESAATELCILVMMIDDDGEDLFGPVNFATFSCAAIIALQCALRDTLLHFTLAFQNKSRPPYDAWFREHLD